MYGRTLLVSAFFFAILTGCASTTTETLRMRAQAREAGLQQTSISGGACDGVGQFMPVQSDALSLEASAEPAH